MKRPAEIPDGPMKRVTDEIMTAVRQCRKDAEPLTARFADRRFEQLSKEIYEILERSVI